MIEVLIFCEKGIDKKEQDNYNDNNVSIYCYLIKENNIWQ